MRRRAASDTITTPRLTLRPPCPSDAAALAAGIGNYDVARWLGAVPFPYGEDAAAKFIAESAAHAGRRWLVFDKDGLVGGVGIDDELGYWIARPAWGRGYATEAAEVAVDVHFADAKAGPLMAGHLLGNDRSRGVLAKLGFRPAEVVSRLSAPLQQAVEIQVMVMARTDWQALRHYRMKTPRLVLRGIEPGDGRALHRILRDPRVLPVLPETPNGWSRAEADRWAGWLRYRGRPFFMALICLPWGRAVGGLMVSPETGTGRTGIGCAIDPAHRGKGYATEATGAFVSDLFVRFGLDEVSVSHFADNPASARVLNRLGFRESGAGNSISAARLEAGENIHYRLSRSDWERAS